MKYLMILILLLALIGCSAEETYFFRATIQEITDGGYIVLVDEGDAIRQSVDLIAIATDEVFEVGDRVIIEYDGVIMESYPGQVNLLSIELE